MGAATAHYLWVFEILAQHGLTELGLGYPNVRLSAADSAAAPFLASEASAALPAARVGGRARSVSRLDRRSWYHAALRMEL